MDVLNSIFVTFANGLMTLLLFVARELGVVFAAGIALVFTRWELAHETELAQGIGPNEEIL